MGKESGARKGTSCAKPSALPERRHTQAVDIAAGPPGAARSSAKELCNLLSVRLVQLSEVLQRGATHIYERRFGVKNTELRILILLGGNQPLAVNELSRRTRVDKGWISRSLDAMRKRGLVCRSAHGSDSRISLVCLTPEGEELLRQLQPVAKERQDQLLAGLDPAEVERVVTGLAANAEAILDAED